jgi:hypothetical protein
MAQMFVILSKMFNSLYIRDSFPRLVLSGVALSEAEVLKERHAYI